MLRIAHTVDNQNFETTKIHISKNEISNFGLGANLMVEVCLCILNEQHLFAICQQILLNFGFGENDRLIAGNPYCSYCNIRTRCFYHVHSNVSRRCGQNGMANSVDQEHYVWIYIICPDLYVQNLGLLWYVLPTVINCLFIGQIQWKPDVLWHYMQYTGPNWWIISQY